MTPPLSRRTVLLTGCLALALSQAPLGAGSAQGAAPQTLDFVAVAADGSPIADLTASQVMLRIDGRARPLT